MNKMKLFLAALFLFITTLVLFSPVREFEFLNYDDDLYITANEHVSKGLNRETLKWALTAKVASNWHPVTVISHLMDVRLFGLENPGAHHLVNAVLHSSNAALLFLALTLMTGAFWRSFFVAFLFAAHPLHVESVAWIAERKDVLSAFFFMLMLIAYAKCAKNSWRAYLLTLFFFLLGLMSKPMLITAPFVLLLLDYWPLKRLSRESLKYMMIEKIPFFLFLPLSALITLIYQHEALVNARRYPFYLRLINSVTSGFEYLRKTVWPHPLAFFYPYSNNLDWIYFGFSLLVLTGMTIFLIRRAKTHPYGIMGWLWYLGMLVPVLGIVQVGQQAMADRYTYLPLIGIFILLIWGAAALFEKWKWPRFAAVLLLLPIFTACVVKTREQLSYWQTSLILYSRALQLTPNNFIAHNNLGLTLSGEGKFKEAVTNYIRPVTQDPELAQVYKTLGYDVEEIKKQEASIQRYFAAINENPKDANAYYNLGVLFSQRKKVIQSLFYYLEALRLNPDDADAHNNVGNIFMRQKKFKEAVYHFSEARRLRPDYDRAWYNLGEAYKSEEKFKEALRHYEKALSLNHDYAKAYAGMADVYSLQGKKDEAVSYYKKALAIDPVLKEAQEGLAKLEPGSAAGAESPENPRMENEL